MRHLTLCAAVALTMLAAGCADEAEDGAGTAAPPPAESSAAEPSESAAGGGGGGGDNVLTGMVGTKEDPDAFVLELTDSSGEKVESLPAGEYTINVSDLSSIHNFHLQGEDVDETTTVPETGDKTFTVELTPGDYEAICDPHPSMVASFTVT